MIRKKHQFKHAVCCELTHFTLCRLVLSRYRPQTNGGAQILYVYWALKPCIYADWVVGCDGPGGLAATMGCPTSFHITGSGLQCQEHQSKHDRAEGNLYVHASRPGRAEVALYVQPPCLDVHIILCTVKLSRN